MTVTRSPNADQYTWIGVSGGVWEDPSNWTDPGFGLTPPPDVPGLRTTVTMSRPANGSKTIVGGGVAQTASLTGDVSLGGSYGFYDLEFGSFDLNPVNGGSPVATAGNIPLLAASQISADYVDITDGKLVLSAGSNVSSTGTIDIGDAGHGVTTGGYCGGGGFYYRASEPGEIDVPETATLQDAGNLVVQKGCFPCLVARQRWSATSLTAWTPLVAKFSPTVAASSMSEGHCSTPAVLSPSRASDLCSPLPEHSRHPASALRLSGFRHDIILAEGLAAESYLKNGNRLDFDADEAIRPNGTAPCHAYVRQGPIVEAVRAELTVCWNAANIGHVAEGKIVYDRHALQRA